MLSDFVVYVHTHMQCIREVLNMAQTEAQLRASKKYHEKLDNIQIRVPGGEKEIISKHAANMGESLNGFVRRAINETMERDRLKSPVDKSE